ncbi:hypothetical protein [Spiroplasma endosymbiont of Asaphidion curtum]
MRFFAILFTCTYKYNSAPYKIKRQSLLTVLILIQIFTYLTKLYASLFYN